MLLALCNHLHIIGVETCLICTIQLFSFILIKLQYNGNSRSGMALAWGKKSNLF